MKKKNRLVMALALICSQSFAQLEINKYSINAGGSKIKGGDYEINASIGITDAGPKLSAQNYELTSGFWTENTDLIYKNGLE